MRKKALSSETIREIQEAMASESLIGVVAFFKEADGVVCIGDIAGTGIALQNDTIYQSIRALETVAVVLDSDLAKDFGSVVVKMTEDEIQAKNKAAQSLASYLRRFLWVLCVKESFTSLVVCVGPNSPEYEGPWEWQGFPVRVEE